MVFLVFTLLLLTISPYHSLSAQHIKFDHLGADEGLSNENINVLFQDQYGYVWIGTDNGLNLYDGYSVQTFKRNLDNSASLSDNRILCITETADGTIWVGTGYGLNRIDRHTLKIKRYVTLERRTDNLPSNLVNALFVADGHELYVGTGGGLSVFRDSTDDFKSYFHINKDFCKANNNVQSIDHIAPSELGVGYQDGVCSFDLKTKSIDHWEDSVWPINEIDTRGVNCMLLDHKKDLWLGSSSKGLFNVSGVNGSVTQYKYDDDNSTVPDNHIRDLVQGWDGRIWVGTDGGLAIVDNYKIFRQIQGDDWSLYGLRSSIVSDLMLGKDDEIWVGTKLGAVNVYDPSKYLFDHYYSSSDQRYSISSNKASGFAEMSNGDIAIATDGGGVNFLNRKTQEIRHLTSENSSLSTNKTLSLCYDSQDGLWIGTWGGGLDYYKNGRTENYRNIEGVSTSLSGDQIFKIYEDSKGQIWVGTWRHGLNRFNRATNDFKVYTHDSKDLNSISSSAINDIEEGADGKLWIAFVGKGIDVLDVKSGHFKHYLPGTESGLFSDVIFDLKLDSQGRMWLGTKESGLALYDQKDDSFKYFPIGRDVESDEITGIEESESGNLFLSTSAGLVLFDPNLGVVLRTYDKSDGLQSNLFVSRSHGQLSSGELLFGGNSGFNIVSEPDLNETRELPKVFMTGVQLFNKRISIDSSGVAKYGIITAEKLHFEHDQNFLSFEYTGISLRNAHKNSYQYRLTGLQDEWIDAGANLVAQFTNLSPGEFVFQVRVRNDVGDWSEPKELRVVISAPYWEKWWFRFMTCLVILIAIRLVITWRTNVLKIKEVILRRLVQERTLEVEQKNLELKAQNDTITQQAEEITVYNEALVNLNEQLEQKVLERTKVLEDHAFYNSHELRRPVSNILGLVQLIEIDPTGKSLLMIIKNLKEEVKSLDDLIREMQANLNVNRSKEE